MTHRASDDDRAFIAAFEAGNARRLFSEDARTGFVESDLAPISRYSDD